MKVHVCVVRRVGDSVIFLLAFPEHSRDGIGNVETAFALVAEDRNDEATDTLHGQVGYEDVFLFCVPAFWTIGLDWPSKDGA